jgi:hypothetical protein
MDFRRVSGAALRGRLPTGLDENATVFSPQQAGHAKTTHLDRETLAVELRDEILCRSRLRNLAVQCALEHGGELARER